MIGASANRPFSIKTKHGGADPAGKLVGPSRAEDLVIHAALGPDADSRMARAGRKEHEIARLRLHLLAVDHEPNGAGDHDQDLLVLVPMRLAVELGIGVG